MKRSKEDTAATRDLILQTAATEFRKSGLQVGVADLMSAAGLTHGGFYRHFESKDQLIGEACGLALDQLTAFLDSTAQKSGGDSPLATVIRRYLSTNHRDHPEFGCALAGLGTELARGSDETRQVAYEGIQKFATLIGGLMNDGEEYSEEDALFILSSLVGAMLLARIIPDRKVSNDTLDVVAKKAISYAANLE